MTNKVSSKAFTTHQIIPGQTLFAGLKVDSMSINRASNKKRINIRVPLIICGINFYHRLLKGHGY